MSENGADGLAKKVIGGIFWVAWGKGAQAVLNLVVLMVLARLLSPLEFGVVSAAMVVVGFSEIVTKLGLGPAVVQRSHLEPRHLGTAFSLSLAMGVAMAALIWIFAPFIAGFFDHEGLVPILRVLSVLFPIRGLGLVSESLAGRDLRFKWLANRDAFCVLIGYLFVGVGLAMLGFGVWSLVAASLSVAILQTGLLLREYPPRHFLPDRKSMRELMYFGGGQTVARIFNFMALQGDNMVVAKTLGLSALGIYGRAYQLMSVQAVLLGRVLDDVLFPSMAKIQHKRKRLGGAYLRAVTLVALAMLPVSAVGFILAPELVMLMLGPQWVDVVLPFRILLPGLLFRTSYKISDSLSRATGLVYRRAWRQAIYAGLVIAGAAVGHFWGVAGVAVGVLFAVAVNFMLMAHLSLGIVGETWSKFFGAHANGLLLGVSSTLIALLVAEPLRYQAFTPALVAGITLAVLGFCYLAVFIYSPKWFIGPDGVAAIEILWSYLPARLTDIRDRRMKTLP